MIIREAGHIYCPPAKYFHRYHSKSLTGAVKPVKKPEKTNNVTEYAVQTENRFSILSQGNC